MKIRISGGIRLFIYRLYEKELKRDDLERRFRIKIFSVEYLFVEK